MAGSANIDSPEVLLELKRALVLFLEDATNSIIDGIADVNRTHDWLQHERLPEMKRQHRHWEQRASEARLRMLAAKSKSRDTGRASSGRVSFEDEEREYKRARAAFEAAEEKLQHINRAISELPRLSENPTAICRRSQRSLEDIGPAALAQLDRMIAGLENYGGAAGGSA